MGKPRGRPAAGFDDADIFSDQDLDLDSFVETMARNGGTPAAEQRAAWQRVEDWKDRRILNEQLSDWDDWDD